MIEKPASTDRIIYDHVRPQVASRLRGVPPRPAVPDRFLPMPLIRDDDEERLARIEQVLENLRRDLASFSDVHRPAVTDARLTREQVEAARTALRAAMHQSKAVRRHIETRGKRKRR